jgi:hypothetical protein
MSAHELALLLAVPAGFGASLHVEITPRFSGEPLQPGSLRYQTSAGESFSITRVSYLLSGFALQRNDGQWLELSNRFLKMIIRRCLVSPITADFAPDSVCPCCFQVTFTKFKGVQTF